MTYWDGHRWIAETPGPAPQRTRVGHRLFGAAAEASLITLLIFGLIAGTTLAAKGGNGKGGGSNGDNRGSNLAVVMAADANGDGAPNWNDRVTFDVTTSATDRPWVLLNCYQDGRWVSTAVHGFFPEYPWNPEYTLASGAWTSGAASCAAELYVMAPNGKKKTLTTTTFAVAD